jgi:hypothetical protein
MEVVNFQWFEKMAIRGSQCYTDETGNCNKAFQKSSHYGMVRVFSVNCRIVHYFQYVPLFSAPVVCNNGIVARSA